MKKFKPEDSIIIFSEARGGSTWLMEILQGLTSGVINWEPLHPTYGVAPTSFGWFPHLKEFECCDEYKKFFEDVLTLKLHNDWTLQNVKLMEIFSARKVITKFVRANGLLPWMSQQFPEMKHKPIYLLRNPVSTAISQLRVFHRFSNENLEGEAGKFSVPDTINNERFIQNKEYIQSLRTNIERQVALWCINNADIIKHKEKKWATIYYENLVTDPLETIAQLQKDINLNFKEKRLLGLNYDLPSKTDFLGNVDGRKKNQLDNYRNILSDEILIRIQDVMNYYEIKRYSAKHPFPIISKNEN